jgi:cytochrome c oxidase subunit 1
MSAVLDPHGHAHGHDHHDDHHAPSGWRRWVYATNHKDIGTLYLLFAFAMLMIGGILALGIRAELFQPGLQYVNPELFNQLTTMHGLIMVFGAIMPAFVGFANWMVPLQIGASDMAFARMNNFSFWLMIPAAVMLAGSFFMPGGAPAAGWTLYAPLTLQMGPSMDVAIFALHILGASSIMGSINIIVTILNMRAPGMTLMKMPMFCWTWLITAYLLIAVMPVLAGAIMPAFVGFANWMIPLQIGASDMAFARMNNFSFWLMIPAAVMLAGSFFMPGGAPATGWTIYAP